MFKGDAESSSFLDFFDVLSGDGVELSEEGFANEGGDACILPVAMAPKDLEVFRGRPGRLVPLC